MWVDASPHLLAYREGLWIITEEGRGVNQQHRGRNIPLAFPFFSKQYQPVFRSLHRAPNKLRDQCMQENGQLCPTPGGLGGTRVWGLTLTSTFFGVFGAISNYVNKEKRVHSSRDLETRDDVSSKTRSRTSLRVWAPCRLSTRDHRSLEENGANEGRARVPP